MKFWHFVANFVRTSSQGLLMHIKNTEFLKGYWVCAGATLAGGKGHHPD
jgi:sulfopyruvate decarboxylase TPP-binding subunit